MSSYARQYLTRPGVTFGSQPQRVGRPARGGVDDRGIEASANNDDARGGGLARFQPRHHPPHPRQDRPPQLQQRRTAFSSREEMFQQEQGGVEFLPIEGSIDANNEIHDFSQVTLSQLSDGPSVRSKQSRQSLRGRVSGSRKLSQGRPSSFARGGGGCREGGFGGGSGRALSQPTANGGLLGRDARGGGGLNLPARGGRGRPPPHQPPQPSQSRARDNNDEEDDASLRSSQRSQPLLSQSSRPRSNHGRPGSGSDRPSSHGGAGKRPSNSGNSRPSSGGGRPSSHGAAQRQLATATSSSRMASSSSKRRRDDDESTTLSPMPPRRLDHARQPSLLRTPLPSSLHRGRSSTQYPPQPSSARTAIRTASSLSTTLASLPTPSRAIRTAASLAARGAASCIAGAMTPFRKGRGPRSLLAPGVMGPTGGSGRAVLGSSGRSVLGSSRSLMGPSVPRALPRPTAPRAALAASSVLESSGASSCAPRNAGNTLERSSEHAECGERPRPEALDRTPKPAPRPEFLGTAMPAEDAGASTTRDAGVEGLAAGVAEQADGGGREALPKADERAGTMPEPAEKAQQSSDGVRSKAPSPVEKEAMALANAKPCAPEEMDVEPTVDGAPAAVAKPKLRDETGRSPAAMPSVPNAKAGNDTSSPKRNDHGGGDDAASATSASTLDMHSRVEEMIAATRELKRQRELLEESRREFAVETERARKEMREERTKLEELREAAQAQFATLQRSMEAFSTTIASSAHEHERSLRTLANRSRNDLAEQARGTMKEMAAEARALVEVEATKRVADVVDGAKKRVADAVDGAVEKAKDDLKEWTEGLKASINIETTRSGHAVGGEASNGEVASVAGGDVASEKENAGPGRGLVSSQGRGTPSRHGRPSPTSSNQDGSSTKSSPRPESGGSTPLPRGGMSTSTTPFSRKTTPLQNNHAKNKRKLSVLSPARSRNEIVLESELHNDFSAVKSPASLGKAGQGHRATDSDTDGSDSLSVPAPKSSIATRNAKTNIVVAKKATLSETKHRYKASDRTAAKQSPALATAKDQRRNVKSSSSKQTNAQNSSKLKVQVTVAQRKLGETIGIDESSKANGRVENQYVAVQKKRSQSAINATKSPRRSKRVKESNRVEQLAEHQNVDTSKAKRSNAKPTKVTPKEHTPKENVLPFLAPDRDEGSDAQLSAIGRSAPSSAAKKNEEEGESGTKDGFDSLLGTSVTVPADDKREDDLIGFDEDEDAQPDRRSLSSLLPFGGFKSRGFGSRGKNKTMSKKKKKKPSSFNFDFYG